MVETVGRKWSSANSCVRSNEQVKEKEREARGNAATFGIIMTALFEAANVKSSISRHLRSRFLLERSAIDSPDPLPRPATSYSIALCHFSSFLPIFLVISIFSRNEKGMGCRLPLQKKKKKKRFIIDSSIEREIQENELILNG